VNDENERLYRQQKSRRAVRFRVLTVATFCRSHFPTNQEIIISVFDFWSISCSFSGWDVFSTTRRRRVPWLVLRTPRHAAPIPHTRISFKLFLSDRYTDPGIDKLPFTRKVFTPHRFLLPPFAGLPCLRVTVARRPSAPAPAPRSPPLMSHHTRLSLP
jgi:hypothetical protein